MLKAPLRTAVVLLCLYLACCAEQGGVAVKESVVSVDTAGVSKLVDTAYLLLRDTQIAASMSYMMRAFDIYCGAKIYTTGRKCLQNFVLETSKHDSLAPIYHLIDHAIKRTVNSLETDTVAGRLYNLKGYFLQGEGKSYEANMCYEVALQKLPQKQFGLSWLIMLNNINQNYNSLGDYKKAEQYAAQELQFIENYGSKLPEKNVFEEKTRAIRSLGWALCEQNKNDEAITFFREALKTTSNEKKYDILTFISKCHLNAHRFDSAFFNVYAAIDYSKRFPKEGEIVPAVDAVHQLARCHFEAGNLQEALRVFYRELPVAKIEYQPTHPDCYKIMVYIGKIYQRMNRPDAALSAFQESIAMSMPDSIPALIRMNPNKDQLPAEYWLFKALEGKTQVYYDRCKSGNSKKYVQEALSSLDLTLAVKNRLFDVFETDSSKNDIQSANLHWYENGIELSILSGDTTRAITYMQGAKAALLKERINQSAAFKNIPDSMQMQHKMLLRQITALESALQRKEPVSQNLLLVLQMQMDRLEKRMQFLSKGYGKISTNNEIASLENLQQQLPEQTAVLDFFFGDRAVYVLALCKNKWRVFTVNDAFKLKKDIANLRNALNTNAEIDGTQIFISLARSAYRELLEAPLDFIEHCDHSINRLWIVPDGPLHNLPFNTLLTTDIASWSGRNMPFLIKKYAIGYAFTAGQFFQPNSPRKGLSNYGGWGISYDSLTLSTINHDNRPLATAMRDFGPLFKAPEEINLSSGLLGGKIWLDSNVTKEGFINEASNFRIVHLAMHAIADEYSPHQSRLVFTANPATLATNDHFLYAFDIYGLTIPADLVVLSACNTASGELQRGEGIASMGRAFQFAGARSVLMTQWSIADNTAAVILPDFFTFLQQGLPKDIALQKAQLAMLERSSLQTPADWAGFMVSGDINPLALKNPAKPVFLLLFVVVLGGLTFLFWKKRGRSNV